MQKGKYMTETEDDKPHKFSKILKKSMQESFLKAAKLAQQTDTALVVHNRKEIVSLKGTQIDDYIKTLPLKSYD